jgi:hypothetical protein
LGERGKFYRRGEKRGTKGGKKGDFIGERDKKGGMCIYYY